MTAGLPRIPITEYPQRHARVQELMRRDGLDLLLAYADDRHTYGAAYARWFAGFAPAFEPVLLLFAPGREPVLLTGPETDGYAAETGALKTIRVLSEFAAENEDYPFSSPAPLRQVAAEYASGRIARVGIGGRSLMGADIWDAIAAAFPQAGFVREDAALETMRGVKSPAEIEVIRYAYRLANLGMEAALAAVRPGVTERQIAAEAEYAMRKNGADGTGIDTIVASGPNTRHILGRTTHRVIENNDFVVITVAPRFEGYHGACARCVFVGEPAPAVLASVRAEAEAQEVCSANLLPGRVGSEVEAMGRAVMTRAGYGENFLYSGLHSVGVIEFEPPILGPSSSTVIEPGMVISIDIPLFEAPIFGSRTEDGYLITENGPERLTTAERLVFR